MLFDGRRTTGFLRYRAARSRRSWCSIQSDEPLNMSTRTESARSAARRAQESIDAPPSDAPMGRGRGREGQHSACDAAT